MDEHTEDTGGPPPELQRISDAERHQVAEHLQRAAGDGRLEVDELEQRLETTWTAKTHADGMAVLSEQKRTGVWRVGREHTASSVLGSVVIDLREAVLEDMTVITARAVLGSVEILVDAETAVVLDGPPVLGEFGPVKDKVQPRLHEASPIVRVIGTAVLGSVVVKRQRRPGEKRPPLLGR